MQQVADGSFEPFYIGRLFKPTPAKMVVSLDLAKEMVNNRFVGGNPFDTYFDCVDERLVTKSLIGYIWGVEVFVDHFLSPKTLVLESPELEHRTYRFDKDSQCAQ